METIRPGAIRLDAAGSATTGPDAMGPEGNRSEPNRPMTPEEFTASVAAVTSAFGDPTRREIYLFVRESGTPPGCGVTATEVAERFELHPNVARHHLEKLTGGGYLTVAPAHTDTPEASAETARSAGRP